MIASVVTRGFGPGATVPLVVTRGYAIGAPLVVAARTKTFTVRFASHLTYDVRFVSALTFTARHTLDEVN